LALGRQACQAIKLLIAKQAQHKQNSPSACALGLFVD
jgi:hypothetical protein